MLTRTYSKLLPFFPPLLLRHQYTPVIVSTPIPLKTLKTNKDVAYYKLMQTFLITATDCFLNFIHFTHTNSFVKYIFQQE